MGEAALVTGEPPTFTQLFERDAHYVYRTFERFGVRGAEAEDLTQEVFVAVFHRMSREQLDMNRSLRPWLCAYAHNLARNYRRSARHRGTSIDAPNGGELESATASPESEASRSETRSLVLLALEQVPIDRRVVLVMHDIDQHDAKTIAAELEIPVNTVYSRLRVAREEFRVAVQRQNAGRADNLQSRGSEP